MISSTVLEQLENNPSAVRDTYLPDKYVLRVACILR